MNQFTPMLRAAPVPRAGVASGGVQVTPGVGPKIATDTVGDQEYQTVKLALGGPGSAMLLEPGQKTAAESIPVVLASDSTEINVDFPAGMATEAKQDAVLVVLEEIQTNTATGGGLPPGAATEATLAAIQGFVDGLEAGQAAANVLLNDIKTNTAAASGPVPPATATVTTVAAAVASTQLLAANAGRKGASLYNDSASELRVKLGAAASVTSFSVDMLPGSYFEVPFGYTGVVHGIWVTATGNARVTELTA